jgi:predicted cation transporter
VSLGPPVGGVVVFAHECENITVPMITETGIIGNNLAKNFFIRFVLKVTLTYSFNARNLTQALDKFVKSFNIMYIQVNEAVKYAVFSTYAESSDIYAKVF